MIPNILSIAGSDPSGGAGIQADLKSISANGGYAMAAITALTAQNTQGVTGVELVAPDFVGQQIATVFQDVRVDAVKVGMIATAPIAKAVANALADCQAPIVLDPVMYAKGGAALLQPDAMDSLQSALLPLATLITPNLPEAAQLLNAPVATNREEMVTQGRALLEQGPEAVLMKGGHLEQETSPDCLITQTDIHWFDAVRFDTPNTHGTGCTLSSALATQLGHGVLLKDAVARAKSYTFEAIKGAHLLHVGNGHGPTDHFFKMREKK